MSASTEQRFAPLTKKPSGSLLLHEIYRSLQGESTYQGLPCVFVRTTVCDLRCVWCDTPHAFTQGTVWTLDDVIAKVQSFRTPLVEITGGEPLVQAEVLLLMTRLCDLSFQVLLETGGHRDIGVVDRRVHIIMDLKCPASGEEPANRWANLDFLKPTDEIKFVIASLDDWKWTEAVIRRHRLDLRFRLLVSPVFRAVEPLDLAQQVLDSGLNVRMQLQLHKSVWHPQARGV